MVFFCKSCKPIHSPCLPGSRFVLVVTALPSLNDGEFGRLMEAVNISKLCKDSIEAVRESLAAKQRSDVPAGSSSEQGDAYKI